jgi:hypothetical protein
MPNMSAATEHAHQPDNTTTTSGFESTTEAYPEPPRAATRSISAATEPNRNPDPKRKISVAEQRSVAKLTSSDLEPEMHADQDTKPTLDLETTASKQEEESDAETAATPYAYYIVAAFLDFENVHSEAVEMTTRKIVFDSAPASWNQEVLTALEEVCHPLFFVSKSTDSYWEAEDPQKMLQRWTWYASFRPRLMPTGHVLQSHGVKACYDRYLTWFVNEEATEKQKQRGTTYLRSCAAAKMRNDTGSRFAASAIWEIGIPNMSETLTTTLSDVAHSADAVLQPFHFRNLNDYVSEIVQWLKTIATAICRHKKTMGTNPK